MTSRYPIPDAALDDRLAFVGTSGSGKTYAAGTAVEHLLAAGARVVIVDPLDVWWGLRVMADGQRPAWPVVIFGGAHADLPLTEHVGALIGETVASVAESCIVSLAGLGTKAAERRFMLAFLDRLYRRATGEPFHIVFDEADLWAPQRSSEPQLQALMEQVVRRGRVKGFIPWLISQRPAVLSKDVLSQADGLIAMKLTSSQDRDALGAWIEGQADRGNEKRMLARLPQMDRGQGVIWLPGHGVLMEGRFPAKRTFDSSSTPKRGEKRRSADLKPINIGAVRARITALEGEKAAATQVRASKVTSAHPATPPDPRALRDAEDRGRRTGYEDGRRVGHGEGFRAGLRAAQLAVAAVKQPEPGLVALPAKRAPAATPAPSSSDPSSVGAERKPLAVLARASPGGLTEAQWATLAGLKRSGGTWATYRSRLKAAGLIEQTGSLWKATPLGIVAAGNTLAVAETPEERIAMWKRAVGAAGKLLDVLVDIHPSGMTKSELADACGIEASGGTFSTYLSRLSGNGLVERSGDYIKASDDLFLAFHRPRSAVLEP